MPHFQTLINFVIYTLPKPVLIALLYRLTILHFASRILPTIGVDAWQCEEAVDKAWEERPVCFFISSSKSNLTTHDNCIQTSTLTKILLTYRQFIFVTVYSHLLRKLRDTSCQNVHSIPCD